MPKYVCIKAKYLKKVFREEREEDLEHAKRLPFVEQSRKNNADGTVSIVLDAIGALGQDGRSITAQAMTLTVSADLADDILYEVDLHTARFYLMKKGVLT